MNDHHDHVWQFHEQSGTDTHLAITVQCLHCDATRTAPVTANGIARNSVEALFGGASAGGHDAWWTIHGEELAGALNRVSQGHDPYMVYTELYANSERDQ